MAMTAAYPRVIDRPDCAVVVPAAGIGSRMGADCPKQYLSLLDKPLIEHTLTRLLSHPALSQIIVVIAADDPHFMTLPLASHPRIQVTLGGAERAQSVLHGLALVESEWVMVHDAARPCLTHADIDRLMAAALAGEGALLGSRVRDTMKRTDANGQILETVPREQLWHALTPQMFRTQALSDALARGLAEQACLTDEASAMERVGIFARMVEGRADNIKVTRPEDLALAALYLKQQEETA